MNSFKGALEVDELPLFCTGIIKRFTMSGNLRRAKVTDTVKMSLLCETKGQCPLCRRALMTKKQSGTNVRQFDIAHIYPLNPTPHELKILKGEPKLSEDTDCEDNFIPLCKPCHKEYDTKKTVEEYRQLYKTKIEIRKLKELNEEWSSQQLHKDIEKAADAISKATKNKDKYTRLSHDALKLNEKTDETFDPLVEFKVSLFITQFYNPIKQSFYRLEQKEKAKSEFIYTQVKSYYLLLLSKQFNQAEIFERMCDWFMAHKALSDRTKAEVLVAYFIQNCEVYS